MARVNKTKNCLQGLFRAEFRAEFRADGRADRRGHEYYTSREIELFFQESYE